MIDGLMLNEDKYFIFTYTKMLITSNKIFPTSNYVLVTRQITSHNQIKNMPNKWNY